MHTSRPTASLPDSMTIAPQQWHKTMNAHCHNRCHTDHERERLGNVVFAIETTCAGTRPHGIEPPPCVINGQLLQRIEKTRMEPKNSERASRCLHLRHSHLFVFGINIYSSSASTSSPFGVSIIYLPSKKLHFSPTMNIMFAPL